MCRSQKPAAKKSGGKAWQALSGVVAKEGASTMKKRAEDENPEERRFAFVAFRTLQTLEYLARCAVHWGSVLEGGGLGVLTHVLFSGVYFNARQLAKLAASTLRQLHRLDAGLRPGGDEDGSGAMWGSQETPRLPPVLTGEPLAVLAKDVPQKAEGADGADAAGSTAKFFPIAP